MSSQFVMSMISASFHSISGNFGNYFNLFPEFSEIICNFVRMKRKEVLQGIIMTMQRELPFSVIERDLQLPIDSEQIVTL